jgi:glycogen(starch) synthase
MYSYCNLSRRQRVNLRNRVERVSDLLGWSSLTVYYQIARQLALKKAYKHLKGSMHKTAKVREGLVQPVPVVRKSRDRFDIERLSLSTDEVPQNQLDME